MTPEGKFSRHCAQALASWRPLHPFSTRISEPFSGDPWKISTATMLSQLEISRDSYLRGLAPFGG